MPTYRKGAHTLKASIYIVKGGPYPKSINLNSKGEVKRSQIAI